MKVPYSQYPGPNGTSIYRPSIPVLLKYAGKFIYVEALIDSGADYTVFPLEIAGVLGIRLDTHTKTAFQSAGGNSFSVYPSIVSIEHILRQGGFRPISWKTPVYFAESQPTILLGNHGFLDRFTVIFHGKQKEVEVL